MSNFRAGERVAYVGQSWCIRRIARRRCDRLVKVPDAVSDLPCGCSARTWPYGMVPFTPHVPVRPGQTILWHAAAGGLGLIAGQWAAHLGANVIGTVGSPDKEKIARANGYHHIINYRTEDFAAVARQITGGKGVDVVYDGVGKDTYLKSIQSLRKFGTWVSFGNASGVVPPLDITSLQKGSIFITRPTLFDYIEERENLEAGAKEFFDLIGQGVISIKDAQSLPLSKAAEAHRLLEGRERTGVIALVP